MELEFFDRGLEQSTKTLPMGVFNHNAGSSGSPSSHSPSNISLQIFLCIHLMDGMDFFKV